MNGNEASAVVDAREPSRSIVILSCRSCGFVVEFMVGDLSTAALSCPRCRGEGFGLVEQGVKRDRSFRAVDRKPRGRQKRVFATLRLG